MLESHRRQVMARNVAAVSSVTAAKISSGREPLGDQRRDAPQRRLLGSNALECLSRLGVRDCRRDEIGELAETRLRPFGDRLRIGRDRDDHAPQAAFDGHRCADRRLEACAHVRRGRSRPSRRCSRRCARRASSGRPSPSRSGRRATTCSRPGTDGRPTRRSRSLCCLRRSGRARSAPTPGGSRPPRRRP